MMKIKEGMRLGLIVFLFITSAFASLNVRSDFFRVVKKTPK